jgi:hypothetical protein
MTRLIPKLFSDESEYFRYYSSQFKYEHYKRNTARIFFAKQYGIVNSYTCEASFHGYFDQNRENFEFTTDSFLEIGE